MVSATIIALSFSLEARLCDPDTSCTSFSLSNDSKIGTIVPNTLAERLMAVYVWFAPKFLMQPLAIAFKCSMWKSAAIL